MDGLIFGRGNAIKFSFDSTVIVEEKDLHACIAHCAVDERDPSVVAIFGEGSWLGGKYYHSMDKPDSIFFTKATTELPCRELRMEESGKGYLIFRDYGAEAIPGEDLGELQLRLTCVLNGLLRVPISTERLMSKDI